jgi:hypothetical protein
MGVPDASVQVLMGFCFLLILAAEAWRGRLGQTLFRGLSVGLSKSLKGSSA